MNQSLIRLRKLLHAFFSTSGRRALRLGVAASIEHGIALRQQGFQTVIDIGANVGQFALFCRELYPDAHIRSFEPLDDCWKTFDSIFRNDDRVQLFRYGIGPNDCDTLINVTNENDSSSILAPATTQSEIFGTKVRTSKQIKLRRLSSLLRKEEILPSALLKIDVQGFELEVLKGCEDLLDCFRTIYVEASYVELYEHQPLVSEVIEFLRTRGFQIRGVFNQHVDKSMGALQADFLFEKAQNV